MKKLNKITYQTLFIIIVINNSNSLSFNELINNTN